MTKGAPLNFLVVVADQLTALALPALLGGRDPSPVKAPVLESLARRGEGVCQRLHGKPPLRAFTRGVHDRSFTVT
ncbi:hypothetical protein AA0312_1580 [Acetobacter tropicalis NRIC 0312]|uniref:Uncharacterized protein n=1 Tax=Acetobacter tropicalis TaxID=104102 RepID=A0A511FLB1_9PROT|nr:hypothetical protein [Acetobacter tropicalis]GBR69854.1 hypothetical protein AA0312_1580 [Acetobacter tropicalis NRIC 0312]GEL49970.1 hypothetical protein ATR01nite_10450 [Acetobacter tropicalis]